MDDLNKKETKIDKPWWQDSIVLFVQLSGWIAIPVIAAIFLGQWLDQKYGTAPWLLLVTVGLSFIISMFGIVKEAKSAINKIEKDNINKKNDNRE